MDDLGALGSSVISRSPGPARERLCDLLAAGR